MPGCVFCRYLCFCSPGISVKPKTKPNFVFQGGLSSVARVRVLVVDVNDNRPAFYPVLYTVSLSTHSSPGTSVVKVTANDPDSGVNGRVTYRTAPGGGSAFFTLNKDTGTQQKYIPKIIKMYVYLIISIFPHRRYFSFSLPSRQSQHSYLHGDSSRGRRRADGASKCPCKRERGRGLGDITSV